MDTEVCALNRCVPVAKTYRGTPCLLSGEPGQRAVFVITCYRMIINTIMLHSNTIIFNNAFIVHVDYQINIFRYAQFKDDALQLAPLSGEPG